MNEPNALVVLSADVVARRATQVLKELAGAERWPAAQRLKEALAAYSEVRLGTVVKDSDPQAMQLSPPTCERCRRRSACDGVPNDDGDCFEPVTLRTGAEQ